jgi:hypothetical protein
MQGLKTLTGIVNASMADCECGVQMGLRFLDRPALAVVSFTSDL